MHLLNALVYIKIQIAQERGNQESEYLEQWRKWFEYVENA